MKVEELLKLVDAGFTKEEILALNQATEPRPEPRPEPLPEPEKAEPEPKKEPESDPVAEALASLNEQMKEMKEQIRKNNLLGAVLPAGSVKQETADDVIARIINPNTKKEV